MALYIRELKYAMSASGVALTPPSPSHRIGILMSAAGRFVSCIDCHLSVEFPAGAHYEIIARQFETHLRGVPLRSKNDAATESACPR